MFSEEELVVCERETSLSFINIQVHSLHFFWGGTASSSWGSRSANSVRSNESTTGTAMRCGLEAGDALYPYSLFIIRGKTRAKGNSGHAEVDTRPGQTRKKPKDLSACDREVRGRGEGGAV